MLKKIDINIDGLHCESCKILLEAEIGRLRGVKSVSVKYPSGRAEIELDGEKADMEKISAKISSLGYTATINKYAKDRTGGKAASRPLPGWILSFLALFLLIGGYTAAKSLGGFELLERLNESSVSLGIIFAIGILAGFHCACMCGGFVIAYSSTGPESKSNGKKPLLPHFQYNGGRIISYTAIGAILGGLGSFFAVNPAFTGSILLVAAVFMVLMGLSFLFKWRLLEKIKLRTPAAIARFLYNDKLSKKPKGPFIIGLLNGFMPCGPLQAMQLYALAGGSALRGALALGIYALGTAALLFAFGMTITKLNAIYVKKMIKVSGLLIIVLGIFMANRGLTNFGYGFRLNAAGSNNIVISENSEYQEVKMDLTYYGYKPNVLYIKKGVPVRWIINVKEMTGCTKAIMIESLGVYKDLQIGENIIEFAVPPDATEIKFSCWMRMVWGKFIVAEDTSSSPLKAANASVQTPDLAAPACSGACAGDQSCPSQSCVCGGNK